jgi:hypothetical protein
VNADDSGKSVDHVGNALEAAAGLLTQRNAASRSIARMAEPRALAPRQLDERRLIHRDDSAKSARACSRWAATRIS